MIDRNYDDTDLSSLKKEDKFERYKYLPTLENLITSKADDSFVLQISGQYGSGKTFFINILKKYLEDKNYNTLYYNAWEHDYAQDAFISFCSIFIQHFDASTPDGQGLKNAAKKLLVSYIPAVLSFVCKTLLGIDNEQIINKICDVAQDIDDNSQITKKTCNDLLDTELERESIVGEFRNELKKLINKDAAKKPLIVFIDDLDRCKADFAIRLLDYIKHLFNISGITFILAVDDEQLKSTVQHFYGSQNAAGYLKRIVDFEFRLPLGHYKNYILFLVKEYSLPEHIANEYLINLLNNLGFIFDLSLRDFKHVFEQVHKIMGGYYNYDRAPYMYFVAYIMKNYAYKYINEISLFETEENKKLNNAQKLVNLFNYKFASNRYYTNSLQYDAPLCVNYKGDHNMKEVMRRMVEVPNIQSDIPCYRMYPPHLVHTNNNDPYQQKTLYEKIWEEIERILGETSQKNS